MRSLLGNRRFIGQLVASNSFPNQFLLSIRTNVATYSTQKFSGKSIIERMTDEVERGYLSDDNLMILLNEKLESMESLNSKDSSNMDKATEISCCALFGDLLVDMGYKKVYLTSVKSLLLAPVWEKQRTLRPKRAELIADAKLRIFSSARKPMSLAGVIAAYHHPPSGDVGIIDGQHRYLPLYVI